MKVKSHFLKFSFELCRNKHYISRHYWRTFHSLTRAQLHVTNRNETYDTPEQNVALLEDFSHRSYSDLGTIRVKFSDKARKAQVMTLCRGELPFRCFGEPSCFHLQDYATSVDIYSSGPKGSALFRAAIVQFLYLENGDSQDLPDVRDLPFHDIS